MATPYLAEPITMAGKVMVGPIVAVDGTTLLAAATIANADIKISKNNAAFATRVGNTDAAVKSENGFFHVELGASDVDTTGHVVVKVAVTGHLVSTKKFAVEAAPQ